MNTGFEIRRRARRMIAPIVGTLLLCYFGVHAFHGDRGIIAWMQIQKEAAKAEKELEKTKAVRAEMERRISLLRSAGIDSDMLDERTRIMTGLMHPQEYLLTE